MAWRGILGAVFRAVILLVLLALLGAGLAWLGGHPPPPVGQAPHALSAPARPAAVAAPAGGQGTLVTPFGDALFRWNCTTGLKEALGDRPDWPLRRVAALCLCAADRLREEGPREIVIGAGDVAPSLAAAEERLCRRR